MTRPLISFSFQSDTLYSYFTRQWTLPKYKGYGTWEILESELYDLLYRD